MIKENNIPLTNQFRRASPEADLLITIIFPDKADIGHTKITGLVNTGIDWEYFLSLALFNEVLPGVFPVVEGIDNLAIPEKVFQFLQNRFERNVLRNKLLSKELVMLNELFLSNGINIINYKGPETLSRIGIDITHCQFNDLDYLIKAEQMDKMAELVGTVGYQLKKEKYEHQKIRKDYTFLRQYSYNGDYAIASLPWDIPKKREILIEPHLYITEHRLPLSIDYKGVWDRVRHVTFEGKSIPTLSKEDLLFILSVNGCKAKWKNLKLIYVISNTLKALQKVDIDKCIAYARYAGAERMLLMGILLASEFSGVNPYPEVVERAKSDSKIVKQTKKVINRLSGFSQEIDRTPASPWRYSSLIMHTLDRRKDKIKYLWRTTTEPRPVHYKRMPLPNSLHAVYRLLVPLYDYILKPGVNIVKKILPGNTRSDKKFVKSRRYNNGKDALQDFNK